MPNNTADTDRTATQPGGVHVNDIHSQLNATRVATVRSIDSLEGMQQAITYARSQDKSICVVGGRHAMGAQQFGTDALLLDTAPMNRLLAFDAEHGLATVEAGIRWPELIEQLNQLQQGNERQWGITQKQTGADSLSLGGALSANIHGRGLTFKPIIQDVESFTLVDAEGILRKCSREENSELFRLAIGGYGLFGTIYSVTLRLSQRKKLERVVEIVQIDELIAAFNERISSDYLYGDFQFAIDEKSDDFLRTGVFACYRPVDPSTPIPTGQKELSDNDWMTLLYLAHTDKDNAFERYAGHYLTTSGQIYWSDLHQLTPYIDDYHVELDAKLGAAHRASEIITEIYVPRGLLADFMAEVRDDFRANNVNLVYGTIRLIEHDDESFLPWAAQSYACIIFNLHTVHTPEGLHHSAEAFRRLIDMAAHRGGSYYLTYHKFATREQVETCHPKFREFLQMKKQYDPDGLFQSDWYRHYRDMFAEA